MKRMREENADECKRMKEEMQELRNELHQLKEEKSSNHGSN